MTVPDKAATEPTGVLRVAWSTQTGEPSDRNVSGLVIVEDDAGRYWSVPFGATSFDLQPATAEEAAPPPPHDVLFDVNGREECDEEAALSWLLARGVLFSNSRDCIFDGKPEGHTVVLSVLCSDVFGWGCADGEDLPHSEIVNLFKMVRDDPEWGAVRWCCLRRNMQPQYAIKRDWVNSGKWDDVLEALPENPDAADVRAAEARAESRAAFDNADPNPPS